jgi:tRNA G46 methylase TrmB
MAQMVRCLKSGGIVQITTDHVDYFEQIREVINGEKGRLEQVEFARAAGAEEGEITGTNYERKYVKDKRDIYAVAARKFQGKRRSKEAVEEC